jgi:hypothetical protein
LTNFPSLLLLSYCCFRLGERYCGKRLAWQVGVLPLLFPLVAWTSRESLLDVALSGWVAAGVFALARSRLLSDRRWSLVFGVIVACGMLTKWTFFAFLFLPVCYALYVSAQRRQSVVNLLFASLVAAGPILFWYLANLAERFRATSTVGTALEADPTALTLSGWLYYPRCLLSYYLYLPLFALFLIGLALNLRKRTDEVPSEREVGLIWAWLLGGLLALTILNAKDPRYVMPLAAPVALLLVRFWRRVPAMTWAILVIATFQFATVSFNVLGRPVKWAVGDLERDPDYLSLSREWVFYQSHYFEVAGPAHREDWRLDELLRAVPLGERLGVLPELPRLNTATLDLVARVRHEQRSFARLGQSPDSVGLLDGFPYVVGKTGDQGISYLTRFNEAVYRALKERKWPIVGRWNAPDGSVILLFKRPDVAVGGQ